MKKVELICTECPLKDCDANSLWCVLSLLTKPNAAQQKFIKEPDRKLYDAAYYRKNRKRKIKAAKQRYRKMTNPRQRKTPDSGLGFIKSEATDNPLNETTSIASPCAVTAVSKE